MSHALSRAQRYYGQLCAWSQERIIHCNHVTVLKMEFTSGAYNAGFDSELYDAILLKYYVKRAQIQRTNNYQMIMMYCLKLAKRCK